MRIFNLFRRGGILPVVGQDIKWSEIINKVLQVRHFDRNGTIITENNEVIAKSYFRPYGFLKVSSPEYKYQLKLPIVHRDDFLLASTVFDSPSYDRDYAKLELLVVYIPEEIIEGGLIGIHHALHYTLAKPGTIEKYYNALSNNNIGQLDRLFGKLVWQGEIKVSIAHDF